MSKVLFYIMLGLMPLRDIFVLQVFGVSVRLAEVVAVLFIISVLPLIILNFKNSLNIYLVSYYVVSMFYILLSFIMPDGDSFLILRELININFYFIMFLSIYIYIRLSTENIKILNVICTISAFYSLLVICNYFTGWFFPLKEVENFLGFTLSRLIGTTSEPAYWGNLMFFPLIILFVYSFQKEKIMKWQTLSLILVLGSCILTFSTLTFVSILLVVLYLLLFRMKELNMQKKRIFFVMLFIAAFVVVLNHDLISEMFSKMLSNDVDISSYERGRWRDAAIGMFLHNPFGSGIGSYLNLHQGFTSGVRSADDAASVFFLYLAERGFLGVLSFLFLFLGLAFLTLNIKSKNAKITLYKDCALLFLGLFFIQFVSQGYIWLYYFWIYLAIIMALLVKSSMQNNKDIIECKEI